MLSSWSWSYCSLFNVITFTVVVVIISVTTIYIDDVSTQAFSSAKHHHSLEIRGCRKGGQ